MDKSVVCPVLIGRADDLASLERLMESSARGKGQTALITGEAGLGKSRLVAETIERAGQHRFQVLQGNCFETDRTFPYAPLLDLLRNFCVTQSSDKIAQSFDSTAPELEKILPDLKTFLPNLTPIPSLEPEQEKRRLFSALDRFFTEQANSSTLIVFEDLHWCDETSLEFLLYFARRIHAQPILLLLTFRNDEVQSALEHFLAELDRLRLASEFVLTRLASKETAAMLGAIFNLNRPVRAEFVNTIYSLTEGNPFFIEEVLKSLMVAGDIFYADGKWDRKPIEELHIPRSVQDAVHRRVERLSVQAKEILSMAAVAGQRFDFFLLKDLTGRDETALLALLKELLAVQLIVEESAERFAFRHALTRQAIYSQLLGRERMTLHQKIGESIERACAGAFDAQLSNLAYHFYQANVWDKALDYSRRAGDKARTLYAPVAAIEHFTHAIQVTQRLDAPPPFELYRARGSAYETSGDFERAFADYQAALQAAHQPAEQLPILLDLGFLWAGRDYAKTGEYYQRANDLACEMNDPRVLSLTLNRLGNWCANVDQPEDALRYHQTALKIFQELNDRQGLAETLDLLGMAKYISGDLIQSEAYYRQAIENFRALDHRPGLVSSLACIVMNTRFLPSDMAVPAQANPAETLRAGEEALNISREIGQRSGEAYALIILGSYFITQGEYARGLEHAQAGLEIAEEIEHRQWMTLARCVLGAFYLDVFALSDAQLHLERALTLAKETASKWWIQNAARFFAQVLIAQGELDRAQSALDAVIDNPPHGRTLAERGCMFARAELALARGYPKEALRITDELIASTANRTSGRVIPRLAKMHGDALAALDNPQAESILLAARDAASEQGALPLLWRIHISLGRLEPKTKSAHFDSARGIIEQLANKLSDVTLRENFLQRALSMMPSAPTLSPRQIAKNEFGGLTEREREVAAMIAQGKSNREIADSLVVSERTIETHVGNVLAKLSFGSRAQIAAWAVEKKIAGIQRD